VSQSVSKEDDDDDDLFAGGGHFSLVNSSCRCHEPSVLQGQ